MEGSDWIHLEWIDWSVLCTRRLLVKKDGGTDDSKVLSS